MKTLFKIVIPTVGVLLVFSFLFLRSPDDSFLICQDRLLNSDQCTEYLNEKYKKNPAASHFLQISDYQHFGMTIENFQVTKLDAASIENRLVSAMTIDLKADTIVYSCTALEDNENVFVRIENPTVQDIDNNRCSSFDTGDLKSRDDLRCEQIGGNPNHPEYEGCVIPKEICSLNPDGTPLYEGCQTSHQMCEKLGGMVVENLSCRESVREQHGTDPTPCDFRGPAGCEFPE